MEFNEIFSSQIFAYLPEDILNPSDSGHRQLVEVKLSAYAGRKSL